MIPNRTIHAAQREATRLGLELSDEQIDRYKQRAEFVAATCGPTESVAFHLANLPFVGKPWTNSSNGSMLVAIIRNKQIITYMFRRDTQPFTPSNLRVDRCKSDL